MFLLLEDSEVILMENIVALVRHGCRTVITGRDNSVAESVFTPATLDGRSSRLIMRQNEKHKFKTRAAANKTRRTETKLTEDN